MKVIISVLLCILGIASPYMMGIDLGSEFFKVTVIKPGKPFMMMENLISKTKTDFVVGLKDNEITYANEALSKKAKSPANIFNYLTEYLGRRYNDTFVKEYMKDFFISYDITNDNETDSISFNFKFNNADEKLSIIEIYAMLFDYTKMLAEKYTKIEMTDAFITIPSFFDYEQRQAIADAIKISKLKLAGVVSENLAAAVQFQLKKKFDNETFYIIYNMGSSFTQASLVSFKTLYEQKENKTVDIGNEIKVYGETYNEKLGGKGFDKNLLTLMMKKFDALPIRKGKASIQGNRKIYEKMRPSAIKYKEVLSANKEAFITVIGVEGGDDLQTKITRDEFEEINKNLIEQVYSPIEQLLKQTNFTLENISQIELIGGSIRIPAIQEEIKKKLGKYEEILGAHMNGDDSMAFGAAYMCANSSKNFLGTRKTFMTNGANEIFKVYLSNLENSSAPFTYCNDDKKTVLQSTCVRKLKKDKEILPLRYKYNSKRSVTIDHDTDILVKITEEFPGKFPQRDLKEFKITGVPEAIKQMQNDNVTSMPKINIKFIYTKGGQIELQSNIKYQIPMYYTPDFIYSKNKTEPLPKEELDKIEDILNKSVAISEYDMRHLVKNTTKKEEVKEENKTKIEDEDSQEVNETETESGNETDNDNETEHNNETKKEKKKNKKKNKKKKDDDEYSKPTPSNYTYNNTLYITDKEKERLKKMKKIGSKKDEEITIDLKIEERHLFSPKPINSTQIESSRRKIERLIEIDTNRTKLIEKRNSLESLIYNRKEWLDSKYSQQYMKPGEKENATEYISNKSYWYDEDGYAATFEVLEKEIKNITKYFKKFEQRQKKHYDRVMAINKFLQDLNNTQQRITKVLVEKPWTEEYFNTTLLKEYNETMQWFNETYTKQENTPLWEPEVLNPHLLTIKMDSLRNHLYEMTKMKNLTAEEKEKEKQEKEKKEKEKKEKKKKKNKRPGDIDLDEILNSQKSDSLEDLIKKYNISREDFEKKLFNSTKNDTNTNESKDKKDVKKKDNKKESDL